MTFSGPIRVLHVLPSMSLRGGMMRVVMNYNHFIDRNAVHFDYLYFAPPDDFVKEAEALGSRSWQVGFSPRPGGLSRVHAFFAGHAGEFDILHCHPIFAAQVMGAAAKRNGCKCVIAHSHSTQFSDKPVSVVRNRLLSHFVGLFATDYVACSEAARVLLGRHGKDAFVLHNAIDCSAFAFDPEARAQTRAELGVGEDAVLLGSIGRLAEQKNQQYMPVILRGLLDRGVDCYLAIAGDGNKKAKIEEKALELGVADRLMLLGSRSDASRLYAAFDVFLLTSLFEGLPVSAVEAQVSGLPCLLSDTITREVAFGDCRFLPLGDDDAWVDAVIDAASCLPGSAKRAQGPTLASAAGYDIRAEAVNLERFYRSILER